VAASPETKREPSNTLLERAAEWSRLAVESALRALNNKVPDGLAPRSTNNVRAQTKRANAEKRAKQLAWMHEHAAEVSLGAIASAAVSAERKAALL
jgi:hypothetical protein